VVLVPFQQSYLIVISPMSRRTKRPWTKRAEQAGKTLNQAAEKTTDSINGTMDNTGAAINDAVEKPVKQHQRKLRIVALKDADGDKRMMNL
jgi:ribosomal protein L31E